MGYSLVTVVVMERKVTVAVDVVVASQAISLELVLSKGYAR